MECHPFHKHQNKSLKEVGTEETPILSCEEVKGLQEEEKSEQRQFSALSEMKGFLVGVTSSLFYTVSVASVNQLHLAVNDLQLNGCQFSVIFLFILPYICWKWALPRPELSTNFAMVWFACLLICQCTCFWCGFASAVCIGIGISGSISRIAEIFPAALANCIRFREMMGWMKVLCIILGPVGIICLYQK